jgi:predicted outer membrane repeat protein
MSYRCRFRLSVAAWIAALAASTSVSAAIIRVDGSLSSSGDGSTWPLAYNNLQTAINVAGPSDQIWVKAGTYKPGTTRSSSFALKNQVRIFGGFAGTEMDLDQRDPVTNVTILSGDIGVANDPSDNCYHVVKATGPMLFPQTVLDGFTITGGNADDERGIEISGGGIYIESIASGEPNACRPLIVRCVLIDNSAADDGGAATAVGAIIGTNTNICEPWFVNCSFLGNHAADDGGAVAAATSGPTFMNCVFSGNSAGNRGGAVASLNQSWVRIANSTLSANSATTTGGVARVGGGLGGAGAVDAVNTILWGNTGGSPTETAQITAGATVNYSCVQGLSGALGGVGNIGSNPLFIDANGGDNVTGTADDDLRLQSASPCSDVGDTPSVLSDVGDLDYDNNFVEPTPHDLGSTRRFAIDDAAGVLGPCDPLRVDMGAYENGDCDGDGTRDEDEVDLNGDGIPDECQDCNGDSILDPEQLVDNDCNNNGRPDDCDIALGCSSDINENGLPDECECGLDIVFVIDVSASIAGTGSDEQEIGPICSMISQIEAALPPAPLVRSIRIAVAELGASPNPGCITQDVEGITGFDNEASNAGNCGGVIGSEDWVNAVELLADEYDWRPDSIRVIVPISDEGGCLGATCASTNASILAAIAAANSAGCRVYPIVGFVPDSCAPVAAAAIADGTDGATWSVSALSDYTATGGIGDQLAQRLLGRLSSCIGQCPADLDGDGSVDAADLAILLGGWGPCTGGCPGDLDGDGEVDAADLAILLGAWGVCVLELSNQMMTPSGGDAEGSGASEVGMTPQELAQALGFGDVAELAQYLGSLDFETMQSLLEAFFGS